jgi:hypothetical protein
MGNEKRTPDPTVAFAKAGGPVAVARITNTTRQTPYKWLAAKDKGGAGGLVPAPHQETLINSGLGITPEDFWRIEGNDHE